VKKNTIQPSFDKSIEGQHIPLIISIYFLIDDIRRITENDGK
jgi:hypothetical protein